jgi:glutamate/tyrosine decarboxylase-like PLP-dependent enzyme
LGAVDPDPRDEVIYVSTSTHDSIRKVARLLCFAELSVIPDAPGALGRMDANALAAAIANDRAHGRTPIAVVGSAGTIDGGTCDDLVTLGRVAHDEQVWFHVDGAFGAWLRIAPAPFDLPMKGIETADSLAFDLHKWLPVPFAVGVLLTKDASVHRSTFSTSAPYLEQSWGLAGGPDWATNYGVALSRPFQALAAYLILRVRGLHALGENIAHCVVLTSYFADLLERSGQFTIMGDVEGNVVLAEPRAGVSGTPLDVDAIAADLQRRGQTVLSTTTFAGRRVLRACFVNHGTRTHHVERAVEELLAARTRAIQAPR